MTSIDPDPHCGLCPRLVAFRQASRDANPDWFNAPVPSWGPQSARLLIVGLAPGMRGANRTGRPFTGDYAGDLLYATLLAYGFAKGQYGSSPDDGLELTDCRITNAVRCVPPQNKPIGAEIASCRPFLLATMEAMPNLKVILALGRIAHENVLPALGFKRSAYPFGHNRRHDLGDVCLIDSYHCSRYNTNTGRLTTDMFNAVFDTISGAV